MRRAGWPRWGRSTPSTAGCCWRPPSCARCAWTPAPARSCTWRTGGVRPVADQAEVRRRGGGTAARAQVQAEAVRQALIDMVLTPSVVPVEAEEGYRPSAALSRTVKTRHARCDFLTCSQPARVCDDEHTRPWPGGRTEAFNLRPRSRWCHRAKQRGWLPTDLPDGTTLWASPSGRQYPAPPQHAPPPPLPPDARLPPPTPPTDVTTTARRPGEAAAPWALPDGPLTVEHARQRDAAHRDAPTDLPDEAPF